MGRPFSRSYGAILPNSLWRVLSRALGYSPCLPVAVCGTVSTQLPRGFSWRSLYPVGLDFSALPSASRVKSRRICLSAPLRASTHTSKPCDGLIDRVTPSVKRLVEAPEYPPDYPSPTPFGLGLGPAKLQRTNLPEETLGFRRERFSLSFSLLVPAFALPPRPPVLTVWLRPTAERSPTKCPCGQVRSFGIGLEPRWTFGAERLDQSAITRCLKDGCF